MSVTFCSNFITIPFYQYKTFRTYPGQSKKYFLCSFDKRFIFKVTVASEMKHEKTVSGNPV